jgi:Flp pilus assembly protein TadD
MPGGPALTPRVLSTVYRKIAAAEDMGGRHEDSLAAMRQAVAAEPNSLPVRLDLARQFARMHRVDEAVAEIVKATTGPDSDVTHWTDAAWLLWQIGRPTEMRALLDRYLARFPNDLEGRLDIGEFFFENNQPADAEKFFRSALAIDPTSPEAQAGMARIHALTPRPASNAGRE